MVNSPPAGETKAGLANNTESGQNLSEPLQSSWNPVHRTESAGVHWLEIRHMTFLMRDNLKASLRPEKGGRQQQLWQLKHGSSPVLTASVHAVLKLDSTASWEFTTDESFKLSHHCQNWGTTKENKNLPNTESLQCIVTIFSGIFILFVCPIGLYPQAWHSSQCIAKILYYIWNG